MTQTKIGLLVWTPAYILLLSCQSAVAQDFVTYSGIRCQSLAFSPDSRLLAGGGYKAGVDEAIGLVKVWDTRTAKEVLSFSDPQGGIQQVAFSPDGTLLAAGGVGNQATVTIWDVKTARRVAQLPHSQNVNCLTFSPSGRVMAVGTYAKDGQPIIVLWDLASKKVIKELRGHDSGVFGIAFSPCGEYLASAGFGKTVRIWNLKTGEVEQRLSGHTDHINAVAFSPKGGELASAGQDRSIRIWNWGKRHGIKSVFRDMGAVRAIVYHPTGKWLIAGGIRYKEDGTFACGVVEIWSMSEKEVIQHYEVHRLPTLSVAITADGARLASGSSDGTIKIWSFPSRH